ncbi:MAG: HAD-IIIA family hydrolase, partial [Planctomycetota bacterium]
MSRRAVFLDRDGTVNVEKDFVRHPDEVELLPGAREAIRSLRGAGYRIVVVTNQSGVARGYLDEPMLARIHARLDDLL